jgi:DNA-binding PadR family transcriptional regulator
MFGCRSNCSPQRVIKHHRPLPERGWIQFLLLRLLYEKPMHGYQLIEEMEDRGFVRQGRFRTGSIYIILNRMEKHGLLSSKQERSQTGRKRRIYQVTSLGREALKRGLEHVLRRKVLLDELAAYYERHFLTEQPDRTERGER